MSAAQSFLTAEQFEELYSDEVKPHFEYWFGEAIQKSMPTLVHGIIQFVISMLLAKRGWMAAPEVRLKISKIAHPVPDVVANSTPLQNPHPTDPFDLCIEILSPRDKMPKLFQKAAHYLDWGIRSVWIIDPNNRNAYMMSIDNPQPIPVDMSGFLQAGAGDARISISLSKLFAETERQLGK